jgi:hypothetical protein
MEDGGNPSSTVYAMDEYVSYYVNTRKPGNLELIRNLVYNNWMSNGLSSP